MAIAAAKEAKCCLYLECSMFMRSLKNCTKLNKRTKTKGAKLGMLKLILEEMVYKSFAKKKD
tara:strand:+ start:19269 stop:19454 length:186 start_codon:yes stop_codon:yes gene_type:complete